MATKTAASPIGVMLSTFDYDRKQWVCIIHVHTIRKGGKIILESKWRGTVESKVIRRAAEYFDAERAAESYEIVEGGKRFKLTRTNGPVAKVIHDVPFQATALKVRRAYESLFGKQMGGMTYQEAGNKICEVLGMDGGRRFIEFQSGDPNINTLTEKFFKGE